jgi:hypothetical protein
LLKGSENEDKDLEMAFKKDQKCDHNDSKVESESKYESPSEKGLKDKNLMNNSLSSDKFNLIKSQSKNLDGKELS